MRQRAITDSSFLYSVYHPKSRDPRAVSAVKDFELIIPQVVLVEVCYLLQERSGVQASIAFLDAMVALPRPLEPLAQEDVRRVRDIMRQYADASLDFVDCCIMALCERLNVTRVLTFDRRDFSIFRPTHCAALELLP